MAATKPKTLTPGLQVVEQATATFAEKFELLSGRVKNLDSMVTKLQRRRMPGILSAIEEVQAAEEALKRVIEENESEFEKPRSRTFHNIRVGYRKGTGSIEYDDADRVVELIEKHYPQAMQEVLIATAKKPVKDALKQLSVAELKKLGCTVEDTGDVVFVAPQDTTTQRLVKALLKAAKPAGEPSAK